MGNNDYLGLSLFIMLLSFFLILNSMSSFEIDKAASVISSVNNAFAFGAQRDRIVPAIQTPVETSHRKGDALDDVEALFNAQIKPFRLVRNRLGTEMHVRMSLSDFKALMDGIGKTEITESNMLDGQGGAFLPTLVSVLQTAETVQPYHMDLTINTGGNPALMQNENPETLKAYAETATYFGQNLESAGLSRKFLSVGLGGGAENTVELLFRRYQPFRVVDQAGAPVGGAGQ